MTVASTTVGADGGVLELGGMRLVIPAGAVAADTQVQATLVTEAVTVEGVTVVGSVFEFSPAGTQFTGDVLVSFTAEGLAADAVPVVYWTDSAGAFQPQPTWWEGASVHTLARHFSRALVGTSATVPQELLCCGGGTCNARGICLPSTPTVEQRLANGATMTADGVTISMAGLATETRVLLSARETPVRPAAFDQGYRGRVLDVSGVLPAGAELKVCLAATVGTDELRNACLGYLDEAATPPTWKCQDTCLAPASGDQLCGKTDHLTNFAILLGGAASGGRTCD